MEITILGLGYVGLPVACAFAKAGVTVYGVDVNERLISNLKTRKYSYTEPGLNEILDEVLDKTLFVSTKIRESYSYIVTVQTPVDNNHKADNSFVESALKSVATLLKDGDIVILESTVPVGSNDGFISILNESGKTFDYCYCPESILPGNIFYEIKTNHRTIGGISKKACDKAKEIYDLINVSEKSLTGIKEAEFVKLIQNSHRDLEIAFVNELSIMCDLEGIDPFEVIDIAKQHPRCNLLYPGSGVGGHCLAVDPYFLVERYGDNASVIAAARKANNNKPLYVANKAIDVIGKDKSKVIGVLGLSYKPNCEDCRESSGKIIFNYLTSLGYKVLANECNVLSSYVDGIPNNSIDEVLMGCDLVIVAQKHKQYLELDFSNKMIIDPVGINN